MDKSNEKIKGIFYITIASIAFGVMPILAKLAYKGGANPISTLALRFTFASIILYIYIKNKNLSLKLNKEQIKLILFLGVVGYSMTSILLFLAYNYIDVGIAGMILHTYPLMVMILSIVIYKEKFKMKKFLYLIITTIGVFIMLDVNVGNVNNINSFVITFYISIISAVVGSGTGVITSSFNSTINFYGIISILLIAFISTVVALMAFLRGVKLIGPTNSAIFGALEPIVSLVLGVIVLGEAISIKIIIGSVIIILAMIELAKDTVRN